MDKSNDNQEISSTSATVENKQLDESFLNLAAKSCLSGKVIKNITRLDYNKLKSLGINKGLIKSISNKSETQKVEEISDKVENDVAIAGKSKLSEAISKRFNDIEFKSKLKSLTIKNQLVIEKIPKPNLNTNTNNNSKKCESIQNVQSTVNTFVKNEDKSFNKIEKEKNVLSTSLPIASSSKNSGVEKKISTLTKKPDKIKNKSLELLPDSSTLSISTNNNSKIKVTKKLPKENTKLKTMCKVDNQNNEEDDVPESEFYGFDTKTILESLQKSNEIIKKITEFLTKVNNSKTKLLEQKSVNNNNLFILNNTNEKKSQVKDEPAEKSSIVPEIFFKADTSNIKKSPLSQRMKKSSDIININEVVNSNTVLENPAITTSTHIRRGRKRKISQNDGNQTDVTNKEKNLQDNKDCNDTVNQSSSKKLMLDTSNVSKTNIDINMRITNSKEDTKHNRQSKSKLIEKSDIVPESILLTAMSNIKKTPLSKRTKKSTDVININEMTKSNAALEISAITTSPFIKKSRRKRKKSQNDANHTDITIKKEILHDNKECNDTVNQSCKETDKLSKNREELSTVSKKNKEIVSVPEKSEVKTKNHQNKRKLLLHNEKSKITPDDDSKIHAEKNKDEEKKVVIQIHDESELPSEPPVSQNPQNKRKSRHKFQEENDFVQGKSVIDNKIVPISTVEAVITPVPKRPGRKKQTKITTETIQLIQSDKESNNEMDNSLLKNNSLKSFTFEEQIELASPMSNTIKRGRKSKATPKLEEFKMKDSLTASEKMKQGFLSEYISVTPVGKKPIEKKSRKTENLEEINNESIVNDSIKKPIGQKKDRKNLLNTSPTVSTTINEKPVICGNCKLAIEAADWDSHIFFHNGVAWREGIDFEVIITDYKVVLNTMINYMKINHLTQVKCEKCNEIRKSAIGLLGHKEFCGLTEEEIENLKEKCPHCEARCRPSGLQTHISNCAGLRQKMIMEKQEKMSKEVEPEELTETGRVKRKTTTLATKTLSKYIETYVDGLIIEPKRTRITGGTIVSWKKQLSKNGLAKCINADCKFSNTNIDVIRIHANECSIGHNNMFTCRNCEFKTELKEDCKKHILEAHPYKSVLQDELSGSDSDASIGEESSESEGDDGEPEAESSDCKSDNGDEDGVKSKATKRVRIKGSRLADTNQPTNPIVIHEKSILSDYYPELKVSRSHSGLYYTKSFKWTKEFRELYYSEILYPNLLPQKIFIDLNVDEVKDYLPDKKQSLRYLPLKVNKYNLSYNERKIKESDWSSLKCFEGSHDNGTQTIFCGGPIISMEWAPLPDKDKTETSQQLLAVCCKKNENDVVHYYEKTPKKCLIQIWLFDLTLNKVPTLLYSIPYDDGYILDMKFCPSGCYDNVISKENKRLGLLAVGSFYGEVNIFSLPYIEKNSNSYRFIKLEPCLTLKSERSDKKLNNLISKISWTKAKEHSKLAAGFVSGVIAIWNLNTKSILLKINEKEILCNIIFQAHLLPIKSLIIFYANNSRWLMTGSTDRKNKFYDLLGKPLPQLISKNLFKSQITCGDWFTNWTTYFVGLDESLAFRNSGVMYHQPLQFGNRTAPILSSEATVTDISCNDFLNTYAACMDSGDIYAGFPHQLLFNYIDKNIREFRCVIGYTDYCHLNKDEKQSTTMELDETMIDENEKINEDDYGLIFCDINEPIKLDGTLGVKRMRRPKFNKYFLTKINQIRFNPNIYNCYHYAIGYETGLIRIRELKNNYTKKKK